MKKGLTVQKLLAVTAASVLLFATALASQPMDTKYAAVDWNKAVANYVAGLKSANLGVTQSAAGFIAEYQLKDAIQPLIEVLKSDKVEQARMSAALALVSLDDPTARAAVQEAALYDGSEKVAKFCESLLNASPQGFSALQ